MYGHTISRLKAANHISGKRRESAPLPDGHRCHLDPMDIGVKRSAIPNPSPKSSSSAGRHLASSLGLLRSPSGNVLSPACKCQPDKVEISIMYAVGELAVTISRSCASDERVVVTTCSFARLFTVCLLPFAYLYPASVT